MGSYEKINYALRPAKSIERKMMVDVLRRLAPFGNVSSYRYIGFGSTYFSDFVLVHKALGISNMVSIEQDVENQERFKFNRPYRCVSIEFGTSNEVLPTLPWTARTIAWLDYDYPLNASVLADVRFFVANAVAGSVVIVSVNAEPDRFPTGADADAPQQRLQKLKERVGETKVPEDVQGKQLSKWGTAAAYRRIIANEIQSTLAERNGVLDAGSRFEFKQLFHFHYADNAKMLTVGGVLYDEAQDALVNACNFEKLEFVRTDGEPYLVEAPNLTYREIRHLDRQLPCTAVADLDAPGVPEDDVRKYSDVYRYFPTFAETEI